MYLVGKTYYAQHQTKKAFQCFLVTVVSLLNIFSYLYIMKETQEYIDCPDCDGEGHEEVDDFSYSVPAVKYVDCQRCEGAQEIKNPEL